MECLLVPGRFIQYDQACLKAARVSLVAVKQKLLRIGKLETQLGLGLKPLGSLDFRKEEIPCRWLITVIDVDPAVTAKLLNKSEAHLYPKNKKARDPKTAGELVTTRGGDKRMQKVERIRKRH